MPANRVDAIASGSIPQIAPFAPFPHPQLQDASRTIDKLVPPENDRQHNNSDDSLRQSQMEQSLKRSVTLVIWYQSNRDPIRLKHEIPTFPLFQISHFPSLISDLELTPASCLDTYNVTSRHWEQHMITTVRTVESEQRLLYKLRKSLLSGLADDECKGLSEELALQPRRNQDQVASPVLSSMSHKRTLSGDAEVSSPKRFFVPENYSPHSMYIPSIGYMVPHTIPYATSPASTPITGPPQVRQGDGAESIPPTEPPFHGAVGLQSPVIPQTPLYNPNTPSMFVTPITRTSSSHQPHPPMKRWPNDYTVSEIADGFRTMDTITTQTPTITQRVAFERVFSCRYVKSTVCRHRAVYRKADSAIREAFERMGSDEQAAWGEFVKKVEGKLMATPKPTAGGDEEAVSHKVSAALDTDVTSDVRIHEFACQPHTNLRSDPAL
ncbi:hypothetical protein EDC04DRAFT_3064581 [Pisolithus marmoratus]|nr:hypothetical protein EDC04DRAFT_3064581 [Pisolithus marmoratus]